MFAEEDHLEPLEAGDVPDLEVGFGLVAAHGGVAEAEAAVASEGEHVQRFGGFGECLGEHHCCEAAVGEAVEFAADRVEGEKMVDIEVAGHFESEFGVVEEAIEDPVVVEGDLMLMRIAFGR